MKTSLKTVGTRNNVQIRSKSGEWLTPDQLRAVAPSIYATRPWSECSERYGFIPTVTVMDAMETNGLVPVFAASSRTKIEGKQGFSKHMIRFRHRDHVDYDGFGAPEIAMVNSHDRTTAYLFLAGWLEYACMNGLLVASDVIGAFKASHTKSLVDDCIEKSLQIVGNFPRLVETIDDMRRIQLPEPAQLEFARAAIDLRFDGTATTTPEEVLRVQREADDNATLWSILNRVQENLVRGGITVRSTKKGSSWHGRTRSVQGIDQGNKLNQAIWKLAEETRAVYA